MIFLDASVLLAAEDTDDPHHLAAAALLRSGSLATIDLALYEATNVAEGRWRDREASRRLQERIWAIAQLGTLIRIDRPLAERISELVAEHGLSAYDAAYLAGAERLGAILASCDQRDLVGPGLARTPATLV
ncbi:MAG: type II toxin-antitoxin system VapC family toxin [Solirubrobacteraceae bacterium]